MRLCVVLLAFWAMTFLGASGGFAKSKKSPMLAKATSSPKDFRFPILSLKDYLALPKNQREKYIRELREAFADLERAAGKPSQVSFNLLFESAFADAGSWKGFNECYVGGVFRPTNESGFCPTYGRPCTKDDTGDKTFLCGLIYGSNVCVDREPVEEITKNCEAKAQPTISGDAYGKVQAKLPELLASMCKDAGNDRRKDPCDRLSARLKTMQKETGATSTNNPAPGTDTSSAAPKPAKLTKKEIAGDATGPTDEDCDKAVDAEKKKLDSGILSSISENMTPELEKKCQDEFDASFLAIQNACKNFDGTFQGYYYERFKKIKAIQEKSKMKVEQFNSCALLSPETCKAVVARAGAAVRQALMVKGKPDSQKVAEAFHSTGLQMILPVQFNITTLKVDQISGGTNWFFCSIKSFPDLYSVFDRNSGGKILVTPAEGKKAPAPKGAR